MKNVDVYLANLGVANVKLHNLHWNVVGPQFVAIHVYLEELYDDFFEKFDEVAEYQKMHDVFPKASLKEYLELSDIEELESKEYGGKESIQMALELVKHMRDLALKIAEETDCFELANMMEDHATGYHKQIWFMENMLK